MAFKNYTQLIDGTNVMTHIANATALSSALSSLPTSPVGQALYTCGLGLGYSAGSTALSGGCALDLDDFEFSDQWAPFWKSASFNLGGSTIVNGKSETSLNMGLTFNFGSKGQQESTITTAGLETDTKVFAFNQKMEIQEEKIYKLESELDSIRKELVSAKKEISSYKILSTRLDKLERLLTIKTASLK